MIRAFDINVSLTVENVRVILQTAKNIETFAITPAWGPPPAWVDLMREYRGSQIVGMKRQAKRKANEYSRSQSFLFVFVSKAWHQELVLRPRRLRGTGGSGDEITERAVLSLFPVSAGFFTCPLSFSLVPTELKP